MLVSPARSPADPLTWPRVTTGRSELSNRSGRARPLEHRDRVEGDRLCEDIEAGGEGARAARTKSAARELHHGAVARHRERIPDADRPRRVDLVGGGRREHEPPAPARPAGTDPVRDLRAARRDAAARAG